MPDVRALGMRSVDGVCTRSGTFEDGARDALPGLQRDDGEDLVPPVWRGGCDSRSTRDTLGLAPVDAEEDLREHTQGGGADFIARGAG